LQDEPSLVALLAIGLVLGGGGSTGSAGAWDMDVRGLGWIASVGRARVGDFE